MSVGVGPCHGQGGLGGCCLQGHHGWPHAHRQVLAGESGREGVIIVPVVQRYKESMMGGGYAVALVKLIV